jgi:hypothetical protein
MKKIFLHIGPHKTGTTSLQQFTRKNHELFADLGLYVPPPGKLLDQHGNEINLGSGAGGLHAIPRAIEHKDPSTLQAFLRAFEHSGLPNALLSSEGFDKFNNKNILFLKKQLADYEIRPIVVLRHPVRLAISIYCSLGRISPIQGKRLIDPYALWHQPSHLLNILRPSNRKKEKISRTNFILRQCNRRIYDFEGICRDWSTLGNLKVFLLELSKDIAKDILHHVFQNDSEALKALAKLEIPRLRSSLPVPLAVLNNEFYECLNIDKKVYHKHIYPYLVNFSRHKRYNRIMNRLSIEKVLPFSQQDQNLFLHKIKKQINYYKLLNYIKNENNDSSKIILRTYEEPLEWKEISKKAVKEAKKIFIKYSFKRVRFKI